MIFKAAFVLVLAVGALSEPVLKARCEGDRPNKAIFEDYFLCANKSFDISIVGNQVKDAKTVEDYKLLFKTYCPKFEELKVCVRDLFVEVAACQGLTYRDLIVDIANGGGDIINVLCENDGEKFAKFIVEGAPQCIERKSSGIRECLNTMQNAIPSTGLNTLPLEEQCKLLDDLRSCVVRDLEDCPTKAAVNLTEALFPFITKASKCKK